MFVSFSLPSSLWLSASCRDRLLSARLMLYGIYGVSHRPQEVLFDKQDHAIESRLEDAYQNGKIMINPIDEQTMGKKKEREKIASFSHHERTPFPILSIMKKHSYHYSIRAIQGSLQFHHQY